MGECKEVLKIGAHNNSLRYQCTPKLTILLNFSYWYFQVHLIEFFQLQKVLRKKVSPRQSYNEKMILWINYLYLEAVNKLSWSIKVPLKVTWRSQTFRLSQNTHGKTIQLLKPAFTLVLYSQRNAFVFESPPLRLRTLTCTQFRVQFPCLEPSLLSFILSCNICHDNAFTRDILLAFHAEKQCF